MFRHQPVMLREVVQLLAPKKNQNFIDATLGLGGHAEALLKKTGPKANFLVSIGTGKCSLVAASA